METLSHEKYPEIELETHCPTSTIYIINKKDKQNRNEIAIVSHMAVSEMWDVSGWSLWDVKYMSVCLLEMPRKNLYWKRSDLLKWPAHWYKNIL